MSKLKDILKALKQVVNLSKIVKYLRSGSQAFFYLMWAALILCIILTGLWIAGLLKDLGNPVAKMWQGDEAKQVEVEADWIESGRVPYVVKDSVDLPELDYIEVEDPEEVEATVTVNGDRNSSFILRRHEQWFPDWKDPGGDYSFEGLGNDTTTNLIVTPKPRSFFELDLKPMLGVGAIGDSKLSGFVGAEMVRMGPLRGNIGLTRGTEALNQQQISNLVGTPIDVQVGANTTLKGNIQLNGGYMVYQNELYLGISGTF